MFKTRKILLKLWLKKLRKSTFKYAYEQGRFDEKMDSIIKK